jgi:hypothetical protein
LITRNTFLEEGTQKIQILLIKGTNHAMRLQSLSSFKKEKTMSAWVKEVWGPQNLPEAVPTLPGLFQVSNTVVPQNNGDSKLVKALSLLESFPGMNHFQIC